MITLQKLTLENFGDYESLTKCQSEGGCYCSFWHQKWASMEDWNQCQKKTPELNRGIVMEKVKSGFHVGVLVYQDDDLLAWVSVGALPEFYWTWRRVAQIGEEAKHTAGILCITVAKKFQRQGFQRVILNALKDYAKKQNWKAIEGYPFDAGAVSRHKNQVLWPGVTSAFELAGFTRMGEHWLSHPDFERSIFRFSVEN